MTGDLDLVLEEIDPGFARFSAFRQRAVDLPGPVSKARLCRTLLQLALEAAVQSTMSDGSYRIVEVRLAPVRPNRPLEGRVEAIGGISASKGRVRAASGRVVDQHQGLRSWGSLIAIIDAPLTAPALALDTASGMELTRSDLGSR